MREIRLADCDIVIINLPANSARLAAVSTTCERIGLPHRSIPAVACTPGAIGCGLSHIKALRAWSCERPLLVLEDDIAASEDFSPTITVPTDADAVYLGASIFGGVEPAEYRAFAPMVLAEPATHNLVRIFNMMASHAILHISARWRDAAIEAMMAAMVDQGWPPDRGLARVQGDFMVYAPQRPPFYQSSHLQSPGHHLDMEGATRITIPTHSVGTEVQVDLPGAPDARLRVVRSGTRLTWAQI